MPVQPVTTNLPSVGDLAPPPSNSPGGVGDTSGSTPAVPTADASPTTTAPPPLVVEGDKFSKGGTTTATNKGALDAGSTGNSQVDAKLAAFAEANKDNPQALAAISATVADIKAHPEQYLDARGNIKADALVADIASHAVGPITIPDPATVAVETGANSGSSAPPLTLPNNVAISTSQNTGPIIAPVETAANSGSTSSGTEVGANGGAVNLVGSSQTYPNLGPLADGDIMALCFIVMMEAAKSAQEDLKSIMDGVKLINKQKDGLRKVQDTINKLSAGVAGKNDDTAVDPDLFKNLKGGGDEQLGGFSVSGNPQTISFGAPGPDGNVAKGAFSLTSASKDGKLTVGEINELKDQIKNQLDSKSELGETESLRLQMAMDRVSKFMTALSNIEKKGSDTSSAIIQNYK